MKYWIEYTAARTKSESYKWEELSEAEFVEICQAQEDYFEDIYFMQLTEPSLVIKRKY